MAATEKVNLNKFYLFFQCNYLTSFYVFPVFKLPVSVFPVFKMPVFMFQPILSPYASKYFPIICDQSRIYILYIM